MDTELKGKEQVEFMPVKKFVYWGGKKKKKSLCIIKNG